MDSKYIETGLSLLGNFLKKIHAGFSQYFTNFTSHKFNALPDFMHKFYALEGYNLY